jgi:hypothetical protein
MDGDAFSLVRELFTHLDGTVPRGGREETTHARELFAHLARSGGRIEAIDDPESFRTPIADLGNWSEDPWAGPTYAIDSSTTRPFEYTNGLITDTAYAKLGVGGPDADGSVERAGTIKTVAYYDDDEASLYNETFGETPAGMDANGDGEDNTGSLLTAELVPFEADTTRTRTLSKAVSAVAQYLAEGEHARHHLDTIDGVLFLDGSLYPLGVLYWLLVDHIDGTSPASSWERPREIVENYIEVIDRQYERGLPVVGVVKTSTTDQMVKALETKLKRHDVTDDDGLRPEVPWLRDHQFVAEVLRSDDLDQFTYTSWFVSTGLGGGMDDAELLDPVADSLEHGTPDQYRRAFFFVRLPRSEFLLRVEAPLLFVIEEETRREIRYKALSEIAKRRDVPYAVTRADRIARITTGNRESMRRLLDSSQPSMDYNWDGRWSEDDATELELQE